MKRVCFHIFLFFSILFSNLHSQNFVWAKQMGGTTNDYGNSITTDASGNVYTTGAFQGTVDFDPGVLTYTLVSNGGTEVFVSKLDVNGNFLWAKSIGGTGSDFGYGITIDGSGNVYTVGNFVGSVDFDPGPSTFTLTSSGGNDIFISKLDASGNFVWAKQMGGALQDFGYSVAIDLSGNVLLTGKFQSIADFDPGATTFNLTSSGSDDIFVSKLDVNGNFVWAKQIGGAFLDQANSINVDGLGNVYTSGNFSGSVDFDPSASSYSLTASSQDVFVSKLNSAGNFVWAKSFGGPMSDYGDAMTLDASGNVYTTGSFSATADFDPSAGTYTLTSFGGVDAFISKLDASGNLIWAEQLGGSSGDGGSGISVDALGNVYTAGSFQSSADFDPGIGTYNLFSNGGADIFISKLNSSGNFVWAEQIGDVVTDQATALCLDASNNIYTTGLFSNSPDFDPGAGVFNLTSNGFGDIYVLKLGSATAGISEINFYNVLKIYPNPTINTLHIEAGRENLEKSEIEISNSVGQTVLKLSYSNAIDISKLEEGFYYLKITSQNKQNYYSKFIKD